MIPSGIGERLGGLADDRGRICTGTEEKGKS